VERVVAGHQNCQRVASVAPRPTDLLPPGGAGAGEAGDDHRVEAGDVDAHLERVGGGQAEEPPAAERLLDLAPLLGEVAAAVARDASRKGGVDIGEQTG